MFYSVFSPTTISLTPCFHQQREDWLPFFTENAQNDPKTHSYEDNAKFHSAFLATMFSYASCFQQKRGVMEILNIYSRRIWKIFSKMLTVLSFVSVSDWKIQKRSKNRPWKSRACVHVRTRFSSLYFSHTPAVLGTLPRSPPARSFPLFPPLLVSR